MLGSCPLWTSFEQVTWGILFYPNKGSLGHLLEHENSSTGLNKRRLINLKVGSCKSTYLSLGLSFLLPTGICLPIYFFLNFYRPTYLLSTCTILPFLLSLYKSIYLHFLCFLSIIICLSSYLFNLSNLSNPFNLSNLSNLSILYPSIGRSILCILSILSIYRKNLFYRSIYLSVLFCSMLFYSICSSLFYSILI